MDQIITLTAIATEDGKWKVKLPPGITADDVTLEVTVEEDNLLEFQPATLGEIIQDDLLGGWEDMDSDLDSAEWVENLRRSIQEQNDI